MHTMNMNMKPLLSQSDIPVSPRKRYFSVDLAGISPFFKPSFKGEHHFIDPFVSTVDSEPKITDEPPKDDNNAQFISYMESKDRALQQCRRRSSTGDLMTVPILLLHWKIYPPSFFEGEHQKEDEEKDWEYLSNPEHITISEDQKKFLQKFYSEYADKDPVSVLNWLHAKATKYQEEKKNWH